jgi:hypothetical protein
MESLLIFHLAEGLLLQIVRGLLTSSRPRHLRELARDYKASPAGVSDILARLKRAGVLVEQRQGNRKLFSLRVNNQERECLDKLFQVYESQRVRQRARRINKHSERIQAKLHDMDEMYSFYKGVKGR